MATCKKLNGKLRHREHNGQDWELDWGLRLEAPASGSLSSNLDSATYELWDFGQVAQSLYTSVSSSVRLNNSIYPVGLLPRLHAIKVVQSSTKIANISCYYYIKQTNSVYIHLKQEV